LCLFEQIPRGNSEIAEGNNGKKNITENPRLADFGFLYFTIYDNGYCIVEAYVKYRT
jgi:hypothetical protein